MSFSVLTEPVIPVIMCDGTHLSMGIREVLIRAHEIQDLDAISPIERYALFRLLEAFAMDMLYLKNSKERSELWKKGRFDSAQLDAYIAECERDGPRFDLFNVSHPFLQSPYDSEFDTEKTRKPVSSIFHSLPSGNNHVFFDHHPESVWEVSCAEAFRALCACYLFCIGDTRGPGSVNGTPPLYCILICGNLFETLVLNMLSERETLVPYGIGKVPWRNNRVIRPKEEVASISMLEGLTWMPRRITLISENHQTVRETYVQAGLKFKGDGRWTDPHVPYIIKNTKDGFTPLKPQIGRAVWRDAGCLLREDNSKTFRQPSALGHIGNVLGDEGIPEWISVRSFGLISTKSKLEEWCEEEIRLPSALLQNGELANPFRDDINMAEIVQSDLYKYVSDYVDARKGEQAGKPSERKQSGKQPQEYASQCRQYFLHRTHDLLFGKCLDEICAGMPDPEHSLHFCNDLKSILRDTLASVLVRSGSDRKNRLNQLTAEEWIWKKYGVAMKQRRNGYEKA